MKILSVLILTLVTASNVVWAVPSNVNPGVGLGSASSCPTSGFDHSPLGNPTNSYGCVCKFAGACDMKTGAPKVAQSNMGTLNGIAPKDMENFGLVVNNGRSVGTICEGDTVAILYDCNAKIPLYAATMITGPNAKGGYARQGTWKKTKDPLLLPNTNLLAQDGDFHDSSKHVYCYKDGNGNLLDWDGNVCSSLPTPCPIHKGHMIAASYGRGNAATVAATFTYTNVVPQVGPFNSGIVAEDTLIKWAAGCQTAAPTGEEARIYVVVGVIPSSFVGKPRYFGAAGFSDTQSKINKPREHILSFPEIMWTAGCCIHTDGTFASTYAFWRRNWPIMDDAVKYYKTATSVGDMFKDIKIEIAKTWPGITFTPPTVFPKEPNCQ